MANLHDWLKALITCAGRGQGTANQRRHDDGSDEWVDAWVRQQERVRKALAEARERTPPARTFELRDEWVEGWIRQERRLTEAIASARQQMPLASPTERGDEWVDGWKKQQRRVKVALAAANVQTDQRSGTPPPSVAESGARPAW